jgi:hypothetical protein
MSRRELAWFGFCMVDTCMGRMKELLESDELSTHRHSIAKMIMQMHSITYP